MLKIATSFIDQIGDFAKNNPTVTTALLGGGLGALGGYLATGNGDPESGETASERSKRRIRNALLLGLAGAGAGALFQAGRKQIAEARPINYKSDEDKVVDAVSTGASALTHPVSLAGIGAGAGAMGGYTLRDWLWNEKALNAAKQFGKFTGKDAFKNTAEARAYLTSALKDSTVVTSPTKLSLLQNSLGAETPAEAVKSLHAIGVDTTPLAKAKWPVPESKAMRWLARNWRVAAPAAAGAGLLGYMGLDKGNYSS